MQHSSSSYIIHCTSKELWIDRQWVTLTFDSACR